MDFGGLTKGGERCLVMRKGGGGWVRMNGDRLSLMKFEIFLFFKSVGSGGLDGKCI